jgi:hypothetical protein
MTIHRFRMPCYTHRVEVPIETAKIVAALPESQAGAQRHACAVCAYERGVADGKKQALDALHDFAARIVNGAFDEATMIDEGNGVVRGRYGRLG